MWNVALNSPANGLPKVSDFNFSLVVYIIILDCKTHIGSMKGFDSEFSDPIGLDFPKLIGCVSPGKLNYF